MTINVGKRAAQMLNAGKDVSDFYFPPGSLILFLLLLANLPFQHQSLEDLIVLRVEKSIDFHVAVSAKYVRSCYGMSLQELVHTLQPVASTALPVDRFAALSAGVGAVAAEAPGAENKLSIPKELWRLVDALWSGNALKEKDLFNSKADPVEVFEHSHCTVRTYCVDI